MKPRKDSNSYAIDITENMLLHEIFYKVSLCKTCQERRDREAKYGQAD